MAKRSRRAAFLFGLPVFVLILAGVAVAGALAVRAPDQPGFCGRCHDMAPFYEAWRNSPHKNVACVACHVDRGAGPSATSEFYYGVHTRYAGALTDKAAVMKQLLSHAPGDSNSPQLSVIVPDFRCQACHKKLPSSAKARFAHQQHDSKQACVDCHGHVGHNVGRVALAKAGFLAVQATFRKTFDRAAQGPPGHKPVSCFNCHDVAKTACASCHVAKHAKNWGRCDACHKPNAAFKFSHEPNSPCQVCHKKPAKHFARASVICSTCHNRGPASWAIDHPSAEASCLQCHALPKKHPVTKASLACTTCHTQLGKSWAFEHPTSSDCLACHAQPARHVATPASSTCLTCHSAGTTWAFNHPSSSDCASCHRAPSKHFSTACSSCHSPDVKFAQTKISHSSAERCLDCHSRPARHIAAAPACARCHRPGVSWGFTHPSGNGYCTACHRRPARHVQASSTCSRCHRAGVSWRFRHPSSRSCASCHRPPANHFGSACASCHSPSVPFAKAVFRHPALRNHTYRSFACSNCHPNGYSSATCAKCHGSSGGPSGD